MSINTFLFESSYTLADLRCMSTQNLNHVLDIWCESPKQRAQVMYAVSERKPTRWERIKVRAKRAARWTKACVKTATRKTAMVAKTTGRWFLRNGFRLIVGTLTVAAFGIAPHAMTVISLLVLLVAAVFIATSGASTPPTPPSSNSPTDN
jgi:Flp pilus assembly protein TadB